MLRKLLAITFAAVALSPTVAAAVEAGDPAPAWTGQDLDGRTVTFPVDFQGTATVLLFWATWCPYCKAFIPELAAIQSDYAERHVRVLGIDFKDDGDPAAYVNKLNFRFRTIVNGDDIAAAYGVRYTPGILVIGRDGTVVYRRAPTDLPAGETLARFWAREVRAALDRAGG